MEESQIPTIDPKFKKARPLSFQTTADEERFDAQALQGALLGYARSELIADDRLTFGTHNNRKLDVVHMKTLESSFVWGGVLHRDPLPLVVPRGAIEDPNVLPKQYSYTTLLRDLKPLTLTDDGEIDLAAGRFACEGGQHRKAARQLALKNANKFVGPEEKPKPREEARDPAEYDAYVRVRTELEEFPFAVYDAGVLNSYHPSVRKAALNSVSRNKHDINKGETETDWMLARALHLRFAIEEDYNNWAENGDVTQLIPTSCFDENHGDIVSRIRERTSSNAQRLNVVRNGLLMCMMALTLNMRDAFKNCDISGSNAMSERVNGSNAGFFYVWMRMSYEITSRLFLVAGFPTAQAVLKAYDATPRDSMFDTDLFWARQIADIKWREYIRLVPELDALFIKHFVIVSAKVTTLIDGFFTRCDTYITAAEAYYNAVVQLLTPLARDETDQIFPAGRFRFIWLQRKLKGEIPIPLYTPTFVNMAITSLSTVKCLFKEVADWIDPLARHSFYTNSHSDARVRDVTSAVYGSILNDPLYPSRELARRAADSAFLEVLGVYTDEGKLMDKVIERAWKANNRPLNPDQSIKGFGKISAWSTNYYCSLANHLKKQAENHSTVTAAEKIVREGPIWLTDSMAKETSPSAFLKTLISLHQHLEKAAEKRTVELRSSFIGDPEAQIYGSGIKLVYFGSKSKSQEFPRIVLGTLLEHYLIQKMRKPLFAKYPALLRLRENIRYRLSIGVKEATIRFGGLRLGESVSATWYFFADGISCDTAPSLPATSFLNEEERKTYGKSDKELQAEAEDYNLLANAKSMIKTVLRSKVCTLGKPKAGIPRPIVNAAQLFFATVQREIAIQNRSSEDSGQPLEIEDVRQFITVDGSTDATGSNNGLFGMDPTQFLNKLKDGLIPSDSSDWIAYNSQTSASLDQLAATTSAGVAPSSNVEQRALTTSVLNPAASGAFTSTPESAAPPNTTPSSDLNPPASAPSIQNPAPSSAPLSTAIHSASPVTSLAAPAVIQSTSPVSPVTANPISEGNHPRQYMSPIPEDDNSDTNQDMDQDVPDPLIQSSAGQKRSVPGDSVTSPGRRNRSRHESTPPRTRSNTRQFRANSLQPQDTSASTSSGTTGKNLTPFQSS